MEIFFRLHTAPRLHFRIGLKLLNRISSLKIGDHIVYKQIPGLEALDNRDLPKGNIRLLKPRNLLKLHVRHSSDFHFCFHS